MRLKGEIGRNSMPLSGFGKLRETLSEKQLCIEHQFSMKFKLTINERERNYKNSATMSENEFKRNSELKDNKTIFRGRANHSGLGLIDFSKGRMKGIHRLSELEPRGDLKRVSKMGHVKNKTLADFSDITRGSSPKSTLVITQLTKTIPVDIMQGFVSCQLNSEQSPEKSAYWSYQNRKVLSK